MASFSDERTRPACVRRTNGPAALSRSALDWEHHFPELATLASHAGHMANAVVPLLAERKPVGALGIAFSHPRCFDDEERALAETMGKQCALALERARLLELRARRPSRRGEGPTSE